MTGLNYHFWVEIRKEDTESEAQVAFLIVSPISEIGNSKNYSY